MDSPRLSAVHSHYPAPSQVPLQKPGIKPSPIPAGINMPAPHSPVTKVMNLDYSVEDYARPEDAWGARGNAIKRAVQVPGLVPAGKPTSTGGAPADWRDRDRNRPSTQWKGGDNWSQARGDRLEPGGNRGVTVPAPRKEVIIPGKETQKTSGDGQTTGTTVPIPTNPFPEPITTKPENKPSKNVKTDLDETVQNDKQTRKGNTKAALPEKPNQLKIADSGVMTSREVQQALICYADHAWVGYAKSKGGNVDMEDFLRQCWLPTSNAAKTDVSERYHIDPQKVMDSLSMVMEDFHAPTLLHLICGQAKWRVQRVTKQSGMYHFNTTPGMIRFTSREQVNTCFERRGELVKYIMRNFPGLYTRRSPLHEVHPPLIYALDKFKHLPVGSNPFLQLFVREDPEGSAKQLEPYMPEGVATEDKGEAEPFDIHTGDSDDEDIDEDEEETGGLQAAAPVVNSEPQAVDPGWIHELIPRICSPDEIGLDCVVKLFPELSRDRLALLSKDENTVLHLAARYKYMCDESEQGQAKLLEVIKGLVMKFPDAIRMLNSKSESPYLHRVKSYQIVQELPKDAIPEDPVTFYLKQLCISQEVEPEETLQLLYAADDEMREQEPRFYLNLSGGTYEKKTFSRTQVESLLDTLALDNVLKFVKIVPFVIKDDSDEISGLKETHLDDNDSSDSLLTKDLRPNNCGFIFKYLEASIGIRAIYEVAVEESNLEDRKIPPHTDDAIRQCLAPFAASIRIWDWQKVDLCSELLCQVAPNAEVVYLYTSGSNAILRSWSSVEGLIELHNLRKVYLTVCRAHVFETTNSIRESLRNFTERLLSLSQRHRHIRMWDIDIEIDDECLDEIDEQSERYLRSFGNDLGASLVDKQEAHEILQSPAWLKKMDSFTNFIINCPDDITYPIKVAVLDDGFDMIDNEFNEPGSIVFKTMDSTKASSYYRKSKFSERHPMVSYSSESGHGTKMVKLIQRLCPKARIYVARLNNIIGPSGGTGPTPTSAAEAIEWAIKCGVDIISMSWAIQTSPSSVAQPPPAELKLKAAIEKAKNSNILMFGASSDEGNNGASDPVIYPAAATGVFCIVAADVHGQLKATVGAERDGKHAYAFPSEELQDSKDQGSSVATALAAGFAALILHSAEISGYGISDNCDLRLLRNHENMAKVFNNLLVPGTRYVGVTYNIPDYVCKGDWDSVGKLELRKLLRKILGSAIV